MPILRIPFTANDRRFLKMNLGRILDSNCLTMGPFTESFEKAFAEFCGVPHAVAVNSGTAALEVALQALGIQKGTVIVPTNTFAATALAVARSGAKVIFADSCPDDFCLDLEDVKRRWRPDVQAVITVHIGGLISKRLGELQDFCERRGVPLIEDGAHAHGCSFQGIRAGALGRAAAFSFFPTKPLTAGEAGMVTTADPDLAARIRILRNQGKDPRRENHIAELGTNWRISELTALLGVLAMKKAEQTVQARQNVAAFYEQHLDGLDGISMVKPAPGITSSYYKFILWLDRRLDRQTVKKIMKEQYGVSLTGEVYSTLCHEEPVWQTYRDCVVSPIGPFPGAELIRDQHICLPVHPDMTQKEMRHVVKSFKAVIRGLWSSPHPTISKKRVPLSV